MMMRTWRILIQFRGTVFLIQYKLERAGRRNENVSARGRAPMDIFTFFLQEPSKIVLCFVFITYIFHFNTVGILNMN